MPDATDSSRLPPRYPQRGGLPRSPRLRCGRSVRRSTYGEQHPSPTGCCPTTSSHCPLCAPKCQTDGDQAGTATIHRQDERQQAVIGIFCRPGRGGARHAQALALSGIRPAAPTADESTTQDTRAVKDQVRLIRRGSSGARHRRHTHVARHNRHPQPGWPVPGRVPGPDVPGNRGASRDAHPWPATSRSRVPSSPARTSRLLGGRARLQSLVIGVLRRSAPPGRISPSGVCIQGAT